MKKIELVWMIIFLPAISVAQVKSFELTNPLALELSDTCMELLTSHSWSTIQIDTKIRGTITETEGRRLLTYNKDGTFDYGYSGTWEIIDSSYIKHSFEDQKHKEVNFGGTYAVVELSTTTLTLAKVLTSTNDMVRTMYFELKSDTKQPVSASSRLKPIFSAPINYYKGKTDPISLDSISKLSMEVLFDQDFLVMEDTIYIHTPDSLYRIGRKNE